jgi:hypothetical protein
MGHWFTWRRTSGSSVSGAEPIGVDLHDDPALAQDGIRQERMARSGHPFQQLVLTPAGGVSAAGIYPDDGAGVAQSGTSTSIVLAADMPVLELRGMLILLLYGTGLGQFTYIKQWVQGTLTATPAAAFDPAPDATTGYLTLVPTWNRHHLHVVAEFENPAATAPRVVVTPTYYDFPYDPPTTGPYAGQLGLRGTPRRSIPNNGGQLTIRNTDRQNANSRETDYRLGQTRSEESKGTVGAKVELITPPGAGRVVLCAAVT